MEPRIELLQDKRMIGISLTMSLIADRTPILWRSFMPRRKEIVNTIGKDLYSLQVFAPGHFENFSPSKEFTKWALVEVSDFETIPEGMHSFSLPGGLYAVFTHKGPASEGPKVFGYILGEWLPASIYQWDDRPQFEILGEKYKNDSPDSEEEIWIPVKLK